MFILSSPVVGGDGYTRQNMLNITAISNKCGHADIFPTVACSTQRPDMKNVFLPYLSLIYRPDIATCIFSNKLWA